MAKRYYSVRTGKNLNGTNIDLPTLASLFYSIYKQLDQACYFQEHFGYQCVDSGDNPGKLGTDIGASLLLYLRKELPWPFPEKFSKWSEDDLFDVIEFLYDHVSKPIDGYYHNFSQCGGV